MRVVIATGIYPPDIGGPATYVAKIAPKFQGKGFEVSILSYGDKDENVKLDSIDIVKVGRSRWVVLRYWQYFKALSRMARSADIIFAQDPMSSGFPSALVSILLRKRLVMKIVGDYVWEQAQQRFGIVISPEQWQKARLGLKLGLWRGLERWIARQAYIIIVPSQYLKSIVKEWQVPAKKIVVIYNAVEIPNVALFSSRKDDKLWITIARLVPWKGVGMLIRLMAHFPNKRLEIIGDGPEKDKLENLIDSLELKSRVKIVGRLERLEAINRLKQSQLFLLNTNYEGLSHTILEALSIGTPVITTCEGGNSELIKDGENGFLLQFNNLKEWRSKLNDLMEHVEVLDKIKNSPLTFRLLSKFNFDYMVDELSKVLKTNAK